MGMLWFDNKNIGIVAMKFGSNFKMAKKIDAKSKFTAMVKSPFAPAFAIA